MPEAKPAASELAATAFIARWSAAGSAERANYALFLTELCALLDVPPPEPAGDDTAHNAYVFERAVPLHQRDRKATTGHIDLYKRGCFVLEAKQYAAAVAGVVDPGQPGSPSPATTSLAHLLEPAPEKKSKIARGSEAWDDAMLKARGQAERYARNLPAGEPTPPFLLVVDVGHVFELYADFSQQGKAYLPFPDARANRIRLADLQDANARAKLRAIWLEPLTLDPAKIAAAVTREVARYLAELAKLFEKKHDPALVAAFLSRCLFCMFAEDIDLLPRHSFTQLLESAKGDPGAAVPLLKGLFDEMNRGGYSLALRKTLLHFNGGLFAESAVLPLDGTQLGLLIDAAKKDWKHVEPAIFGTLLERALNPAERHKLGAHYTPRAYVERLVLPTLVEPLREEWEHVRAAAVTLAGRGDLKGAIKETRAFHHRLCAVRVLDPACGSGNFLYVALEHLKRLEGFGENMRLDLGGETVDPHQFLGIEINPRAATIAELVLWIGYLQWHHRNRGSTEWPEPVLRAFKNIECRDAVLAYDKKEFAQDAAGKMRFVWDRKTMKIDPATGREVPDDKAVVPLETFVNPRPAEWPQADFIVGNPPFVANRNMREELRDGYVDALDRAFADIEQAVDFVMLFWKHAARLLLNDSIRRFGLVSTSRIRQKQNRSVVEYAMASGSRIIFATPDHPWDEDQTEASVRIAMTVLGRRDRETQTIPHLLLAPDHDQVAKARPAGFYHPDAFRTIKGREIHADLSVDIDLSATRELRAWSELCHAGMKPYAETLLITDEQATALFPKGVYKERHAPPYRNGQDIARRPRGLRVLDFFGLSESEIHQNFPKAYDYLVAHTKAERSQERNPRLKREWWLFEANRAELRSGIRGLDRYIVTVENSPLGISAFFQLESCLIKNSAYLRLTTHLSWACCPPQCTITSRGEKEGDTALATRLSIIRNVLAIFLSPTARKSRRRKSARSPRNSMPTASARRRSTASASPISTMCSKKSVDLRLGMRRPRRVDPAPRSARLHC